MKNIVVYHGKGCSTCHEEMQFLAHHGISFTAKDVVSDIAARQELLSLGSKTLPTTVIDGETNRWIRKAAPERIAWHLNLTPPMRDAPTREASCGSFQAKIFCLCLAHPSTMF